MQHEGQEIFEFPYHASLTESYQELGVPSRKIYDLRSEERKINDLLGQPSRSLNEDLGMIRSKPYILSC